MAIDITDAQIDALLVELKTIDTRWSVWQKKQTAAFGRMPPAQNIVQAIYRKFSKLYFQWSYFGIVRNPLPIEYFKQVCRLYSDGTANQRATIRSAFQTKPGGLWYLHWFYSEQIESFRQEHDITSLQFALLGIAIENTTPDDYYDGPEQLEISIYTTQLLTTEIKNTFKEIISISDTLAAKWLWDIIEPDAKSAHNNLIGKDSKE